ncbi:biotin/lipoate--protein ligase family protein [Alkalilacustris brevis]|uniref:biotin/lipoate--protein ligase family protein n=1 Tax=Alkalilacustris brevis TaxID=2026338 RepID=UPI000E0DE73D|nr:biotin/lipoate--protein ligase family protein [Alkalilacustris brevis]
MSLALQLPPLMRGLATGPTDPFKVACGEAEQGTDAGLLTWSITPDRLRAALVLAPEAPLEEAMAGYIACSLGIQNALGAMGPPEVAVHLGWDGEIRLNGARCGAFKLAASPRDPRHEPDWLVVGLSLTLRLSDDVEPGETPDRTSLRQEGCGEIGAGDLLEAWARYSMLWLSELERPDGRAVLHREWEGLVWKQGGNITASLPDGPKTGHFLGVDENFGLLLKQDDGQTRLIPLSALLGGD